MNDPVANARLIRDHFEAFVNQRDLGAIDRNVAPDFIDHDGPGGRQVGRDADRAMMATMHELYPDLRVEIRDLIASEDKVVVRNVWTGTDRHTGAPLQIRGFVLWRIADGRIVERWATVTTLHEAAAASPAW